MPNHSGHLNPHWKGGRIWRGKKHPYPCLLIDGKYVPEHRLLAEKLIGRKLHPKERVYCQDGDLTNITSANTRIVTASVYGQLRQNSTMLH